MSVLNNTVELHNRQPHFGRRSRTLLGTPLAGQSDERRNASVLKRVAAVAGGLFLAIFMAVSFGVGGASAADLQCGGIADTPGLGIDCHVTVVNNLDLNDPTQTSSTTTITSCTDAFGPVLAGACDASNPTFITTTTTNTALVHDISQCNYSANGDGGIVYCTIDVLNQITGTSTAPVAATVNECNGSVQGGGGTINCDGWVDPAVAAPPSVNVTNADVTQCNDSAIGGGNAVDCSVATDSTVSSQLPVTINQCNNSANNDGSIVICRVRIRTVIRSSIADTSYSTNTASFTALPTTGGNALAAPLEVVVPAIVVVPAGGTGGTTSNNTGTGSSNRLVNTGSLAATGSNPAPAGLLAILVILLGITGVVTSKRIGFRKLG